MSLLSKKYRDRPMPPMDLAIWHIEHAARYPEAVLASPGRLLNWVVSSSLDVFIVILILILLVIYSLYCIYKIFRCSLITVSKLRDITKKVL